MYKTRSHPFYFEDAITASQHQYFKEYGILRFRKFVGRRAVAQFTTQLKEAEQFLLANGVGTVNGSALQFGRDAKGLPLIRRLPYATRHCPALQEFLHDPRMRALLRLTGNSRSRIGEFERDGLVAYNYSGLQTHTQRELAWHTDGPPAFFQRKRVSPALVIGVHLDDCPFGTGGFRFLPGSHKQGLVRICAKRLFTGDQPSGRSVGFDIEAGDLTIHDGRLWHRELPVSPSNESTRRVMNVQIIAS